MPAAGPTRHGGEQVVGFVLLAGTSGDTQRFRHLPTGGQLKGECVVRKSPVGFVLRVKTMAEARLQAFVEGRGDIGRSLGGEKTQKKGGETVNGLRGETAAAEPVRLQSEVAAENIDRAVDQVEGCHSPAPGRFR